MRQARARLAPAELATGDRPHHISAHPGTMVSAHMPDASECQRYGLTPDIPILVIIRPGGQKYIARGDLTSVVLGDPADPVPPDQARDAALFILGIISEDLSNVGVRVAHLAAALGQSPGSVASLAVSYHDEKELEHFCSDTSECEHAARAAAKLAR
jgi:hypothetical protein